MTESEKQVLSERIATVAETEGINPALLWEAAKTCPQGHYTRDPEWGDFSKDIGDVCHTCWLSWAQIGDYGAAHDALLEYANNQSWHPEWRIGRQAKDMTDPAVLLPVMEAWRDQQSWRVWKVESAGDSKDTLRTMAMGYLIDEKGYETHGFGDDPMIALAQALCAALEAKKGERS